MRGTAMTVMAAAWTLSGCVMKGTYEAKEAELAGCQSEAAQTLETLVATRETLAATQEGAETDRAEARFELDRCVRETHAARSYADALDVRERNLREMLKNEVAARDVEISRLRDQLSVAVLDRILFRSGSAEILKEGRGVLDTVARLLAVTDDMIRVEGHTDNVPIGSRLKERYPSNWELSGARASSVVRYFEDAHGIAPTRMEAVGFSEYRPVAEGETPEIRLRNRRVEIVLTAPDS